VYIAKAVCVEWLILTALYCKYSSIGVDDWRVALILSIGTIVDD
jgi:hypothetical protein